MGDNTTLLLAQAQKQKPSKEKNTEKHINTAYYRDYMGMKFKTRVSKYGKTRLHAEIPIAVRNNFIPGETIYITKEEEKNVVSNRKQNKNRS